MSEKPNLPKIVQIACAKGEPIVGLGEDGLVYMWYVLPVGHWELYGNREEKE